MQQKTCANLVQGTGGAMTVFCAGLWRKIAAVFAVAVIAGCGSSGPVLPDTRVIINSSPVEGAEVVIMGESRGQTPVTVEGLPPGWVDVLLRKENYRNTIDRVEVRLGQASEYTIKLEPLVGYLTMESDPPGAEVFLKSGESLGKTPFFRKPMSVGEYAFTLRYENYLDQTDEFEIRADYQYEKLYNLRPLEGRVQLTSRPSGARVWINNEPQERKTPFTFTLPPGAYVVSVYSPGYVQGEERVALAANETKSLTVRLVPGDVPPGMVLVPEGEFIMGADNRAPDEGPVRRVHLKAFYIDKYEVTNAEYKEVFPNHKYQEGQDQFPVTGVSWTEATRYASAVGKRLPTEAEWEKAARGEDGREFPWGNEFNVEFCNSAEADILGPVRVGRYLGGASPYGCVDMAGNAYEWTSDWYEAYPGNTEIARDYGQIYRVLRGGSYRTPRFDVRASRRFFDKMDEKKPDYGFRCAMDVTEAVPR